MAQYHTLQHELEDVIVTHTDDTKCSLRVRAQLASSHTRSTPFRGVGHTPRHVVMRKRTAKDRGVHPMACRMS